MGSAGLPAVSGDGGEQCLRWAAGSQVLLGRCQTAPSLVMGPFVRAVPIHSKVYWFSTEFMTSKTYW